MSETLLNESLGSHKLYCFNNTRIIVESANLKMAGRADNKTEKDTCFKMSKGSDFYLIFIFYEQLVKGHREIKKNCLKLILCQ